MAAQLGINLNDPVQAAQRARELGVPESTIQEMLRSINEAEAARAAQAQTQAPAAEAPTTAEVVAAAQEQAQVAAVEQQQAAVVERDIVEAEVTAQLEETTQVEQAPVEEELPFFGYDLFENIPEAFAPNPIGPVDDGYLVGPGDELFLTVWGAAEFQYTLPVDLEGRIFVQRVGQIMVAGKRLNVLREDIKRTLSRSYSGLESNPPSVFMDLTVARLRPIHIFVLGEVGSPGGYTVSSYSTLFNVLYSVGGPLTSGSLRSIDVIRGARKVETLDLYSYLLRGFAENPIRLQSNDFVFIPPRGRTVAISGQVFRPAVFELKSDETFADLLEFAGGLQADAYSKRFQIQRIIPFEERNDPSIARRVIDLELEPVLRGEETVNLQDGDIVSIFSISDRIENAVTVSGAVFQPGRYELSDSLITVRDLIEQADGLTEVAYLPRAELVRIKEDFTEQFIPLDLGRVLSDDPTQNIPLKQRDRIRIYSREEIQGEGSVSISGRVRSPSSLPYREDLTLYDLLFAGGGLQDTLFVKSVYLERADLIRTSEEGLTERIIPFKLGEALAGRGLAGTLLKPGDSVRIYALSEIEASGTVSISGQVRNPGTLPYREDFTLADLLFAGGGLQDTLFIKTVFLERADFIRTEPDGLNERIIPFNLGDALVGRGLSRTSLKPGDAVRVYAQADIESRGQVSISGQIRNPQTLPLTENLTVYDLLFAGGGLLDSLYVKTILLDRADLFRKTPDGLGEIVIPFNLGETLDDGGVADMLLQPGDEVRVYSRSAVRIRGETVQISGAVRSPGTLAYRKNLTLEDVILQAGGFTPVAFLQRAEVTRSVYSETNLAQTISVPLLGDVWAEDAVSEDTLSALFAARQFQLEPLDHVYIRTDPSRRPEETVSVTGEVRFPGSYAIEYENEPMSSFVRRAGGLLETGYAKGGRLFRGGREVVVDFPDAIRGKRKADVALLPGDQVFFPRSPATVEITGNVYQPGLIKYRPGKRVQYYIDRAGGLAPETESIYVRQANGATRKLRRGLFPNNPKVDEGGVITVTQKPPKDPEDKVDIGEIITETLSVIATALTAIIIATKL